MLCAIDPGLQGAAAFFDRGRLVDAIVLPTKTKGSKQIIDGAMLGRALTSHNIVHTVIEDVFTMPGQGIASSGSFMEAKGVCYGVAEVIGSTSFVTPAVWKRGLGLIGKDKEASRNKAIELYPDKADLFTPKRLFLTKRQAQDQAEAALIGKWYLDTVQTKIDKLLTPIASGGKLPKYLMVSSAG